MKRYLFFAYSVLLALTAQAVSAQSTKATPTPARKATTTLSQKTPIPVTKTPSPAQVTATARAEIALATQEARNSSIAFFAEYLPITRQELVSYAEEHVGEKVLFAARVFNIVKGNNTTIQVDYAGSNDGIYVETLAAIEGVYEGTSLTIYGEVAGTKCFENTMGNEICNPHITNAVYVTKLDPILRAAQATAQVEANKAAQERKAIRATAAAEAKATVVAISAEYETIPWRELVNYAERHAGEKVKVSGRIFNIVPGSDTQLQITIAGTSESMFIEMKDSFSGLYENTNITVYGEIYEKGYYCFENSMGSQVCQPALVNAFYTQ